MPALTLAQLAWVDLSACPTVASCIFKPSFRNRRCCSCFPGFRPTAPCNPTLPRGSLRLKLRFCCCCTVCSVTDTYHVTPFSVAITQQQSPLRERALPWPRACAPFSDLFTSYKNVSAFRYTLITSPEFPMMWPMASVAAQTRSPWVLPGRLHGS